MSTKRDHDSDILQDVNVKRRKFTVNDIDMDSDSPLTIDIIKQFTVTLDSSGGDYYSLMKFITIIYIEQHKMDDNFNELVFSHEDVGEERELIYNFPEGREITITYKDEHVTCVNTKLSSDHGTQNEVVYLYGLKIIAKTKEIIDSLILEATVKKDKLNIYHYVADPGYWKKNGLVQQRSAESLVIDKTVMTDLFEDIELFCAKESEAEYSFFGQPYKRNYLFHGLPGTGKSSLVSIIANKWKRNIYIVCFDPQLTDSALMSAVASINDKNSILLLEDIDCVFQNRESESTSKSNVSYSTLFNVLDGVSRVKGMITIITTNFVNKLDKALIRPGRVDFMVGFDIITEQQLLDLLKIYSLNLKKETVDKIYSLCEEKELVPAVLSGFLFRNRKKNLTDIEYITLFKKYLTEINPVYTKKITNGMYG